MAFLPDQCCHACRARCLPGKDHCAQHPPKAQVQKAAQSIYDRTRFQSEDRKVLQTALRGSSVPKTSVSENPICRSGWIGRQCRRKSNAGEHHIIDPRDNPELKLSWGNLVALCKNATLAANAVPRRQKNTPHHGCDGKRLQARWPRWRISPVAPPVSETGGSGD